MLGEGTQVTVDVVHDIFEGRFFWWEVERTKLNFQPGSVSFFYNIQNDLAMITVNINKTVIIDKQKLLLQILS